MRFLAPALLLCLCVGASGVHAGPAYTTQVYTVSGASGAYLYDINNSGLMVGNAQFGSDNRAFVAQGSNAPTFLSGPSGALNTVALGLSDNGIVVGAFADSMVDDGAGGSAFGPNKGFIYDGRSYTSFVVPGATETVVRAVSPNGRYLTGYAIDDSGFIGWRFDRSNNALVTITTGILVIAQGVDDAGTVIGSRRWSEGGTPRRESFLFAGDSLGYFSLVGQTDTRARDINASGTMTGWVRDGDRISAFVGAPADYTLFDFNAALGGTYAEGINNAGFAVGSFVDNSTGISTALIFAPVPEPTSAALLLGGLGLLAARRRRD